MELDMYLCCCASCNISFAIPKPMERRLRECHNTFYCPSGHTNYFAAKSDAEIAKEMLAKKEREVELLKIANNKLSKSTKASRKPAIKPAKKVK